MSMKMCFIMRAFSPLNNVDSVLHTFHRNLAKRNGVYYAMSASRKKREKE